MKKAVLILTILLIGTSGLYAQSSTKIIKKKHIQQLKKIENGIKSGEITKVETKKLIKQERKLSKLNKKAKADGFISPKEKSKLKKEAKKLDNEIYKEKHDKQKRKKEYNYQN
jgi:hypothetical protein